jgi:hypothetical protein
MVPAYALITNKIMYAVQGWNRGSKKMNQYEKGFFLTFYLIRKFIIMAWLWHTSLQFPHVNGISVF